MICIAALRFFPGATIVALALVIGVHADIATAADRYAKLKLDCPSADAVQQFQGYGTSFNLNVHYYDDFADGGSGLLLGSSLQSCALPEDDPTFRVRKVLVSDQDNNTVNSYKFSGVVSQSLTPKNRSASKIKAVTSVKLRRGEILPPSFGAGGSMWTFYNFTVSPPAADIRIRWLVKLNPDLPIDITRSEQMALVKVDGGAYDVILPFQPRQETTTVNLQPGEYSIGIISETRTRNIGAQNPKTGYQPLLKKIDTIYVERKL